MIFDKIANRCIYYNLASNIEKAFAFYENALAEKELPDGKYESGNGIFASVQTYKTKPLSKAVLETHQKYVDIQIMLEGEEKIGFANVIDCKPETEYEEQNDIRKYSGNMDMLTLRQGEFAIFLPHDAHAPCISSGKKSETVRKLVIKVPLSGCAQSVCSCKQKS